MALEIISEYFKQLNIFSIQFLLIIIGTFVSWTFLIRLPQWFQNRRTRPPGPIGLPFVGYMPFLGEEPHKTLWKMTKKYGDVIGLYMGKKYTVILNEYSVVKEVLTHAGSLDRAPNLFDHLPCFGFGVENGEKWHEQRRFTMATARDLGLGKGSWEDLFMDEISNFVQEIQTLKGKPVDITHSLFASISSNIISILIGRRLKKDEDADKIKLSMDFSDVCISYTSATNPANVIPGVRKLMEIFKISGYDRTAQIIRDFGAFIREEINRHKSSPELSNVNDFINIYLAKLSTVSNLKNGKHFFSEFMLEGNVSVLFLGGSDTILSSLGFLLRFMADYKNVQDKVYTELMEVLGNDRKAKYEERNKIPYTFAVIMESQRYSSIVTLSTNRKANQDIPIRGYIIPKGAEIISNLWLLHHDPKYWDEPDKFLPQRFLTDNGTKLLINPPSYAPFSIGRRNCPGETIAFMEILGYFTEIVKRFEISTPPGIRPEYNIKRGLVYHLYPQELCFKERT